ncbi:MULTISPECIES: helix-turn-helix transcriptional regulator [Anaeromyxobacter]|uniref:helix-turn-helix domain-containing protein n=1 Tax=Anaeromyxobacter TaxID=161492 RepID=UPI001F593AA5|nr:MULTISPECIES: helix-turn-helix transcriptional regulator [unclassified Anaeromyxobacter]
MTDPVDPTGAAPPDVPTDDPGASAEERLAAFGRWLARERELRGLSRDEVTRATKLAPGVVEALESGEEARMPPRAYVVGYLRSYAIAAGLDATEVVLRYEEAAAASAEAGPRGDARGVPAGAWVAAAVALAAAIAAAIALLR